MTPTERSVRAPVAPMKGFRDEIAAHQRGHSSIARQMLTIAPGLGTDELVAGVDAAELTRAVQTPSADAEDEDEHGGREEGLRAAALSARAARDVWRWRWPHAQVRAVKWDPMGTVVPVLAAAPGSGASVVAAALSDALQARGHRVLLADTADPVRSGLSRAARTEGSWSRGPHPAVNVRFSWRQRALLGRLDTQLPVITPGMVPGPPWWLMPDLGLAATVVDVAHDAWRVAANPTIGAGAWLRHGSPAPRPVLVCRASAPSLISADAVLSRLDAWASIGTIAPVEHLVVIGARRWPPAVTGVASQRLLTLVEHAVFVPYDRAVAAHGVTADPLPVRVRAALAPIVDGLGLPRADASPTGGGPR